MEFAITNILIYVHAFLDIVDLSWKESHYPMEIQRTIF